MSVELQLPYRRYRLPAPRGWRGLTRYGRWAVAGLLAAMLLAIFVWAPAWSRYRFRAESARVLRAAGTPAQREAAAGPAGRAWANADGSWVVVRYTRSSSEPRWTEAVALDSGGNWYESSTDYGQSFAAFALDRWPPPDLATARQRLTDVGFRPMAP